MYIHTYITIRTGYHTVFDCAGCRLVVQSICRHRQIGVSSKTNNASSNGQTGTSKLEAIVTKDFEPF